MRACILVGVAPEGEAPVVRALEDVDGVVEAFPVLGQAEVVLRTEVDSMEALTHLLKEVTGTDGVLVSETFLEIPDGAIA